MKPKTQTHAAKSEIADIKRIGGYDCRLGVGHMTAVFVNVTETARVR